MDHRSCQWKRTNEMILSPTVSNHFMKGTVSHTFILIVSKSWYPI